MPVKYTCSESNCSDLEVAFRYYNDYALDFFVCGLSGKDSSLRNGMSRMRSEGQSSADRREHTSSLSGYR